MPIKQIPSVGRMVHYIDANSGEHQPAIITKVYDPRVSLMVFTPEGPLAKANILQDETKQHGDTWHWSEYVPPVDYGEPAPALGRLVHYVSFGSPDGTHPAGECRAAIITSITHDPASGLDVIGLCVFNPSGIYFNAFVPYDKGHAPGSWHWPEKEDMIV